MRHLTTNGTSLLTGDLVADLLIDYAVLLGQERTADRLDIRAITSGGRESTVTVVLNGGVQMLAETTTSALVEPDNAAAELHLRSRIDRIRARTHPSFDDVAGEAIWNAEEA